MEGVMSLIANTERSLTEDIDLLTSSLDDPHSNECLDRMRINLSAGLTELRLLIYDKHRVGRIAINMENAMRTVNNHFIVFVHGSVINANTVRASGAFSLVWNVKHQLNVDKPNILTMKTPDSSHLLGLLALSNQMEILNIKKVYLLTTGHFVKKIIEQLPVWHAREFRTDENIPMHNQNVLEQLYEKIVQHGLQFVIIHDIPTDDMRDTFKEYSEIANRMVRAQIRSMGPQMTGI